MTKVRSFYLAGRPGQYFCFAFIELACLREQWTWTWGITASSVDGPLSASLGGGGVGSCFPLPPRYWRLSLFLPKQREGVLVLWERGWLLGGQVDPFSYNWLPLFILLFSWQRSWSDPFQISLQIFMALIRIILKNPFIVKIFDRKIQKYRFQRKKF